MSDLRDLLKDAFVAGCMAAHENYQPHPDPDFDEAGYDYAASVSLPPAPDGATEGWNDAEPYRDQVARAIYTSVYSHEARACPWGSRPFYENMDPRMCAARSFAAADALIEAERAASPSVSSVRPKGEEDEQFIARIIANHMMDEFEWPRSLAERTGATLAATIIWANPSQPTQTGEENAGLVEDAATDVEALEKQATRIIFEAMPRPECCQPGCTITPGVHPDCGCYMDAAIIAYDLRHLLAPRSPIPGRALQNQLTRNPGELAATNPIPGELKALSDAAPAGEPLIDIVADAWAAGFEGASFFEVDQEKLHFNAFEYAKNRLAKTHQVAEGGETS